MWQITPTRYWRLLVRSSFSSFTLLLVAIAVIGLSGCTQNAQLANFKKFTDPYEVPKISVEDAKKEVDAGNAVIVDGRVESAYKQEHITGSINIPNGSPKEKYDVLPKGKKVIIYCSCNGEGTSISLAYHMNQAGVPETYAMVGGTAGWISAGYPMTKGQ